MSQEILRQLQILQPASGKSLSNAVVVGLTGALGAGTQAKYQLMRSQLNPKGGHSIFVPTNGSQSLLQKGGTQAARKLKTLPPEREDNLTGALNTSLLGGEQYPILTATLGTLVSGGAAILFTVATTYLSVANSAQRVLGRAGDEIWQVEEIGKGASSAWFDGNTESAYHVGSFFLVDPYRSNLGARSKAWLIHEERTELTLL